jgi:hypothetical protein
MILKLVASFASSRRKITIPRGSRLNTSELSLRRASLEGFETDPRKLRLAPGPSRASSPAPVCFIAPLGKLTAGVSQTVQDRHSTPAVPCRTLRDMSEQKI